MRVAVNQQFKFPMARECFGCDRGEPFSLVTGAVGATRVRAVRGQPRSKIGVNPTKGLDRQWIAQDAAQHPITSILSRAQSIAVLDSRTPSSNGAFPPANMVLDTNIFSQHLAAPTIMIPGNHQDRDIGLPQISERGQDPKARSGNHRFPLEPKLEKVSVNDQGAGATLQLAEKVQDLMLDLRLRKAQVKIGDHVARG
jgi:hypothetical protein